MRLTLLHPTWKDFLSLKEEIESAGFEILIIKSPGCYDRYMIRRSPDIVDYFDDENFTLSKVYKLLSGMFDRSNVHKPFYHNEENRHSS